MQFAVVGAEKCSDDLRQQFRERYDAELLEGYGATELGPVVSINRLDVTSHGITEVGNKPGSVGRPLPGIEVVAVDPERKTRCDVNEEGLVADPQPSTDVRLSR